VTARTPSPAAVTGPVGITRIGLLALQYAEAFDVPLAEVREWYRTSDDRPGLVAYWQMELSAVKERRRQWFQELRPHGFRLA